MTFIPHLSEVMQLLTCRPTHPWMGRWDYAGALALLLPANCRGSAAAIEAAQELCSPPQLPLLVTWGGAGTGTSPLLPSPAAAGAALSLPSCAVSRQTLLLYEHSCCRAEGAGLGVPMAGVLWGHSLPGSLWPPRELGIGSFGLFQHFFPALMVSPEQSLALFL